MYIGNMKHYIEIWGKTESIDPILNEKTHIDAKIKSVYAEIIPLGGSITKAQANTQYNTNDFKIKIRSSAAKELTNTNYIMYKGYRYNIKHFIQDFKNNNFVEIFAEIKIE